MRNQFSFDSVLNRDTPRSAEQASPTEPVEGTIVSVDTERETATFVVPDFHNGLFYGPAPYGRAYAPPEPGDRCLVVWVGRGVDRAWIVSWAVKS